MAKVRALVLAGNGTNCERETAHACRLAGADEVHIVFVWDLLAGKASLGDYNFLVLPGGFMDGDDLGAAKAGAHRFKHGKTPAGESLFDQLQTFIHGSKLVLGICNGFQLMVKLGLIPNPAALVSDDEHDDDDHHDDDQKTRAKTPSPQEATVWANDSGRFEDHWVHLTADKSSPCVFTQGTHKIDKLDLPIRHGEGKVIFGSLDGLKRALDNHLVPLFYASPDTGRPTEKYPENPNGSPRGIAGICDPSGRLFGLMPHPEAYSHFTNHPRWSRDSSMGDSSGEEEGTGMLLFKNGVDWLHRYAD